MILKQVEEHNGGNLSVPDAIAAAQVHALLAIAARLPPPVEYRIEEPP